jgi:hypothetical protein
MIETVGKICREQAIVSRGHLAAPLQAVEEARAIQSDTLKSLEKQGNTQDKLSSHMREVSAEVVGGRHWGRLPAWGVLNAGWCTLLWCSAPQHATTAVV